MRSRSPAILVALTFGLVAAAAVVLVADNLSRTGRIGQVEEYQRLVGGLGLGPAVDLTRCAFRFDPRLCPTCPEDQGPVAGGSWFCPCQGCSIFYYRGVQTGDWAPEMGVNGLLP
jgi:hypothetical protein